MGHCHGGQLLPGQPTPLFTLQDKADTYMYTARYSVPQSKGVGVPTSLPDLISFDVVIGLHAFSA